jgi:putative ABC transport system permease protein
MEMSLPQENLLRPADARQLCSARPTSSVPGVKSVSAIAHLPLSGGTAGRGIAIEGRPDPDPKDRPGASYTVACPNILRTLGIPLKAGREFTERDTVGAPGVALINEAMAKRYWPNEDAVGKRFQIGDRVDPRGDWLTIVGVLGDVRHRGLDRWRRRCSSALQPAAWPFMRRRHEDGLRAARSPLREGRAASSSRSCPWHPSTPWRPSSATRSRRAGSACACWRVRAGRARARGGRDRRRGQLLGDAADPGDRIRLALGAQPGDVLRLIVRGSLSWTLAARRRSSQRSRRTPSMETLVFGVKPTDPFVLGAVSVVLLAVSLGAAYLPAREATGVDPVTALRSE